MTGRVAYLDDLRGQNMFIEFYDPDGQRYGLPTYPWRLGPRWPADHPPAARQRPAPWRPGHRRADPLAPPQAAPRRLPLPRRARSKPKRQATSAQLAAIAKALQARRTCPTCGNEKPYCIPRSQRRMQRLRPGVGPMTALPRERPFPVNKSLTPNQRRRVVENDEYAAFLRRVIRAYSRRVAAGDIEAIADMASGGRRDRHRHARRDLLACGASATAGPTSRSASASPGRPRSSAGALPAASPARTPESGADCAPRLTDSNPSYLRKEETAMPANVESMFSVRQMPWHREGTILAGLPRRLGPGPQARRTRLGPHHHRGLRTRRPRRRRHPAL